MKRLVQRWEAVENHMVEGNDEPIPTPPEDDGGEGRQKEADDRRLNREKNIADMTELEIRRITKELDRWLKG